MSNYRPYQRHDDARSERRSDYDAPSSDRWQRSDPYSERQEHRARSPYRGSRDDRHGGGDDGEYHIKGRAAQASRDDHRDGCRRDDRPPPAKRTFRGRPQYEEEEDFYAEPPAEIPYRGENDVSADGRPLRLLLIRNLKESMAEDLFAKGLEKLNLDSDAASSGGAQVGATEGSLRRVLIIRDRQTDKSMHYGFAEYHSIQNATAALAKADEMGDKCTIASKVVEITFPHLGVFPRADFGANERTLKYTVHLASTGQMHKYHDDRYYASELMVNANAPGRDSSPSKNNSEAATQASSNTLNSKDKSKKRKAPAATSGPAFLQHWQNKAAELRTEDQKAQDQKEKERSEKASKPPASGVNAIENLNEPSVQTFAIDRADKKCCYLCNGQFQTSEGLQRHLKESTKHATSLESKDDVAKGHERMIKAGVSPDATIKLLTPATARASANSAAEDQAYRDRAAERRKQDNSSKDSSALPSFSLKSKTNIKTNSRTASPAPAAPAEPSYGKGMNLLQKAGWSAGQGLGNGSGIAAPIEQSLYAQGVGLGHEGGKMGDAVEEAERMTKGNWGTGFVEKTREVARKRYEGLG